MDDALDIMADGDFDSEQMNKIEFFYSPENMTCPIDGCKGSHFASKTKYQRHWDEQHVHVTVSYACPVRLCKQYCRRRTDMKSHIRNIHKESNPVALEDLLSKSHKEVRENKSFIDPGFFIFRGRSKVPEPKTIPVPSVPSTPVTPTVSSVILPLVTNEDNTIINVTIPKTLPSLVTKPTATPVTNISLVPDTTPVTLTSRISVEEYRDRKVNSDDHVTSSPVSVNTQLGCSATSCQDFSSQAPCLDLPLTTLPAIPEDRTELEAYLRWLCNCMDCIGRQREAAKEKLEEMRRDGSRLQQEREMRRKLEAENRKLKAEIADIKWREHIFGTMEP